MHSQKKPPTKGGFFGLGRLVIYCIFGTMNPTVKFNNVNTLFSKALKQNIAQYFKSTSFKKTGNRRLFLKAAILLGTFVALYGLLVFVPMHWAVAVLLCMLFGINLAAIGFNIMHDAGHQSFSDNKRVNTILSYSLNLLGGNIYFWKLKHNIAHHTYTNIDGEDHDIEIKFMRGYITINRFGAITVFNAFIFRCCMEYPIWPGFFIRIMRNISGEPWVKLRIAFTFH